MADLRTQLIKLAYKNPGTIRQALLPILARSSVKYDKKEHMTRIDKIKIHGRDWDLSYNGEGRYPLFIYDETNGYTYEGSLKDLRSTRGAFKEDFSQALVREMLPAIQALIKTWNEADEELEKEREWEAELELEREQDAYDMEETHKTLMPGRW